MQGERIACISEIEKIEIQKLYERKVALQELVAGLKTDSDIYERVINDLSKTQEAYAEQWNKIILKYNLKSIPNGSWELNYNTNEILLNYLLTK